MNDVRDAHPSVEELTAFDRGQLQPSQRAAIERHVATCDSCCHRLDTIADDPLILLLRTAAEPTPRTQMEETRDLLPGAGDTPSSAVPAELMAHARYRILGLLGAGGMGAVFKAEHRLMERTVALKIIHKNLTARADAVERFRQEVKTAARLDHPNIVTAYDAEQAGDIHFLVMEFIEGTSLDRVVRAQGRLPIALACHIVRQAALGLQHAYERGMVHRDIKPGNILLTPSGQVKVLDFGLARFVSENGGGSLTVPGAVVGTPDYVAPEQALDSRQADIRADIYGLGCTLYFLLTGRPPFPDGSALQKLMAHQQRRPSALSVFRQDVPAELVRILERMMAKDAAQRYQTPAEVAEQLAPFVGGDTASRLAVSPPPNSSREDETILDLAGLPDAEVSGPQRHSQRPWLVFAVAAAVAGIVLLGTTLGGVALWWQLRSKAAARNAPVIPTPEEPVIGDELRRIDGNAGPFTHAALSPDGRLALVAGLDFKVTVWDLEKGAEIGRLMGHTGRPLGLAISRDGRRALSGAMDKTVRLWDLKEMRLLQTLEGHTSWVRGVAFVGDKGLAISGGNNAKVLFWDALDGRLLLACQDHLGWIASMATSRSGRLAVSASNDRTALVWDLIDQRWTHCLRGHEATVLSAVLSDDDRYVLSGSEDKTLRFWELKTDKTLSVLRGHTANVLAVALSADNRRALSGGEDGTVRLWDVEKKKELHCYTGHSDRVIRAVGFCADGRCAVSAGSDGTFRFWRLP